MDVVEERVRRWCKQGRSRRGRGEGDVPVSQEAEFVNVEEDKM